MTRVLALLMVVLILASLRATLAVLVVALAIMLLFYSVTRPRQALMFLGNVVLLGLASTHPAAFIIGVGIIGATVVAVVGWHHRRPTADSFGVRQHHRADDSDRHLLG